MNFLVKGRSLMFKRINLKIILLFSLVVLTACQDSSEESDTETVTSEESVQFVMPQSIMPSEISIVSDEDTIELLRENARWYSEELDHTDETAIAYFIEDLRGIKGKRIEKKIETSENLSITIADEQETIDLLVWNEEEIVVQANDVMFQVEQLPESISPFNKLFLEPAVELGQDTISELVFRGEEEVTLNQTTNMTMVETLPFISGWYLHGPYDTDFSVEFNWMGQMLDSFSRLHGKEAEQNIESVTKTIEVRGSESNETLEIGEPDNEGYTLVKVMSQNQHYLVPSQIIDAYQFEFLDIADNFVALIPLDAVERVELDNGTDRFILEADHEVSLNEEGEVSTNHAFYFNNEPIEENVMRRAYQYLARLSYYDEVSPEDKEKRSESESTTIKYHYLNEGETVEKIINLYPIEGTDKYIVENDGVIEFTMTNDRVYDLIEAFSDLNN